MLFVFYIFLTCSSVHDGTNALQNVAARTVEGETPEEFIHRVRETDTGYQQLLRQNERLEARMVKTEQDKDALGVELFNQAHLVVKQGHHVDVAGDACMSKQVQASADTLLKWVEFGNTMWMKNHPVMGTLITDIKVLLGKITNSQQIAKISIGEMRTTASYPRS